MDAFWFCSVNCLKMLCSLLATCDFCRRKKTVTLRTIRIPFISIQFVGLQFLLLQLVSLYLYQTYDVIVNRYLNEIIITWLCLTMQQWLGPNVTKSFLWFEGSLWGEQQINIFVFYINCLFNFTLLERLRFACKL